MRWGIVLPITQHALHSKNIIQNLAEEHYGLHLINQILHARIKRLQDWPSMPLPQMDWAIALGNRLIADQQSYDIKQQNQLAAEFLTWIWRHWKNIYLQYSLLLLAWPEQNCPVWHHQA